MPSTQAAAWGVRKGAWPCCGVLRNWNVIEEGERKKEGERRETAIQSTCYKSASGLWRRRRRQQRVKEQQLKDCSYAAWSGPLSLIHIYVYIYDIYFSQQPNRILHVFTVARLSVGVDCATVAAPGQQQQRQRQRQQLAAISWHWLRLRLGLWLWQRLWLRLWLK